MTELSPEDKAHVNRIVDAKMETMRREAAKLKSPMRAALDAIQQAEREEIRRQALREAAKRLDDLTIFASDIPPGQRAKTVELMEICSAAILALIDAPPAAVPENKAVEVLKAYEEWEADLILCREAWDGGSGGLPILTESLWDRLLGIQEMRNVVLA